MPQPTVNNRYRIRELLGQGGSSSVFLAQDLSKPTSPRLALKIISPQRSSPELIRYFKHEYQFLAQLAHPNIAQVFDFDVVRDVENPEPWSNQLKPGYYFFSMEYADGKNLYDFTADLPLEEVYDLIVQTCRGLEYIHSRGIVHCDIKPANLFVCSTARPLATDAEGSPERSRFQVKILDFGLASAQEVFQHPRGTFHYMAPEMFKDLPIDRRADLYSLGVVLYHVLTRKLPFDSETSLGVMRKHIEEPPEPPEFWAPSIPGPLSQLVLRLLAKEPWNRFPSANRVILAINEMTGRRYALETRLTSRSYIFASKLAGRDDLLLDLRSRLGDLSPERAREAATVPGSFAPTTLPGHPSAARPPLILLGGETGIGKSRLLRELKHVAELADIRTVFVRCREDRGEADASSLGLASARSAVPPDPSTHPDQDRDTPAWPASAFADSLMEQARQRPLLVCVEDLEEAGDLVCQSLRHLAHRMSLEPFRHGPSRKFTLSEAPIEDRGRVEGLPSTARLLVLVSFNPEKLHGTHAQGLVSDLLRDKLAEDIRLRPLGRQHVEELLSSMLGKDSLPTVFLDRLHELTSGNPLYVEETLKSLVDQGTLEYTENGWRLHEAAPSQLALPEAIKTLAQNRLGRLAPNQRQLLEVAALAPSAVPLIVLERFFGDAEGACQAVHALEQLDLVSIAPRGEELRVQVRNQLLRDLVRERMPEEERRRISDRLADAMETAYGPRRAEHIGDIALLRSQGAQPDRASAALLEAAQAAANAHRNSQAITYYERAFTLVPEEPSERRIKLLETLAGLYGTVGEFPRGQETFETLLKEKESALPETDRVRILRKLAMLCLRQGEWNKALGWADRALRLAQDTKNDEVSQLLYAKSWILCQRGEFAKATELAKRGLKIAEAFGQKAVQASLSGVLVSANIYLGNYHEALATIERIREFREKTGDLAGVADCHNNLGTTYGYLGELDKAVEEFRRTLELRERIGDIGGSVVSLINLGGFQRELGEFRSALSSLKQALEIQDRRGMSHWRAHTLQNLGTVTRDLGQLGQSFRCLEETVQFYQEREDRRGLAIAYANLAYTHMYVGNLAEAERLAAKSAELAQAEEMKRELVILQQISCELSSARGNFSAARDGMRKAMELSIEIGTRMQLAELQMAQIDLEILSGETEKARELCRKIWDDIHQSHSKYFIATLCFLRGRAEKDPGAPDYLSRAIRIASEIGYSDMLWQAHHAMGNYFHFVASDLRTAEKHYQKAADLLHSIWATVPPAYRDTFMKLPRRERLASDMMRLKDDVSFLKTFADPSASPGGPPPKDREKTAVLVGTMNLLKTEAANLGRLIEINKKLTSELDLDRLLESIIDAAIELTNAERGFLLLLERGQLSFEVARSVAGTEVTDPDRQISHSIAERVALTGESILTANAQDDERFRKHESVAALGLRSVLSIPIRGRQSILGALYLENRGEKGIFTEAERSLIEAFGDQAAIAIENARLYREYRRKQQELEHSNANVESLNLKLAEFNKALEKKVEVQSAELAEVKENLEGKVRELQLKYRYDSIIAKSPKMKELFRTLDRVTDTNLPVLLQGESGTGKELVARAIHYNGPRRKAPFICENCAAIAETLLESELFGYVRGAFTGADRDTKGLFEAAHGGTLFLDEIGETTPEMQKKLLRVLQERQIRRVGGKEPIPIDVRIVSASNRDLKKLVEEGKFREDLFYRLNVIPIQLPPLRERREDIAFLAEHFLGKLAAETKGPKKTLSRAAINVLLRYDWPGNVRELENEVNRVYTMSGDEELIETSYLSPHILESTHTGVITALGSGSLEHSVDEFEKRVLERTLEECGGNRTLSARKLGITRRGLYKKLEKFKILKRR